MSMVVIVGGGISGLIAAKYLEESGVGWVGLEKTEKLGGRLMSSVPRVHLESNRARLEQLFPNVGWEKVEEPAAEAKKGSWSVREEAPEPHEAYFVAGSFYQPSQLSEQWLLQSVSESVKSKFELDKTVVRIAPAEKKFWCADGSERTYDRMLWCAPLGEFYKACPSATPLWKIPKNRNELGCAVIEMHCEGTVISNRNAVSLSFRFGDGKIKATGNPMQISEGRQAVFWNIYLEEGLAENKEEVAHCLRNFKRELSRQFPDLTSKIVSEKIVYLPRIVFDQPLEGDSFELVQSVYYLGSEAKLKEANSESEHLDLLVENASYVLGQIHTSMGQSASTAAIPENS